MHVVRLVLGDLQTNCFLVDDAEGGPCVVIDPAGEPERLLAALEGLDVVSVVLTHGHFDHLGAVRDVLERTGAPLLVHEFDAERIVSAAPESNGGALFGYSDSAPSPDVVLAEDDEVAAGSLVLRVLHTPGHTPGSICLVGHGHLFAGDTLFAGSIGRTDFPGGDVTAMQRSIERLSELADSVVVHPGHGPDTTIGRERAINPFFPRA